MKDSDVVRDAAIRHIRSKNCLFVVSPIGQGAVCVSSFETDDASREDILLSLIEAELAIEAIRESVVSTMSGGKPSLRAGLENAMETSKKLLREGRGTALWGRITEKPQQRQKGDE